MNTNLGQFATRSILLGVAAAFLFAQPAVSQDPTVTIVSRSELVLIPVIVRDKSAKHVSGLTKDTFRVYEDGNPKDIAMFEEVRSNGTIDAVAAKGADIYSNFMSADESPRRLLIIVFDMINTPFLQQARAREELIDFLSNSIKDAEPVALLTISGKGVRQIHSFTTDPRVLVAALKRVKGQVTTTETDLRTSGLGSVSESDTASEMNDILAEEKALRDFSHEVPTDFVRFRERENVRETLRCLEEIAQAYAGLPGRKSMIWATSGIPFLLDDPRSLMGGDTSMIYAHERAWRALNQANMAVYPVDLKGVLNYVYEERFDPSMRMPRRSASEAFNRYDQLQTSMQAMANATGGQACLDRNDLRNCFKIATEDSEAYYLLGYYLGTEQRKPGWHKLKVTVTNDQYKVRARSGFLVGDPKQVKEADLKTELGTALAANLDYTGLHFDLRWTHLEAAQKVANRRVEFELKVNPSAITIDTSKNNHMNLEIAAIVNDTKGKYVTEFSKNMSAELKPESVAQIRKSGLKFRDALSIPQGKYLVKFAVRDNATGKMGTVAAPLEVN